MKAQVTKFLTGVAALLAINSTTQAQYSFTTLEHPQALGTIAHGIWGTNVVGFWENMSNQVHGFLYSGGSWTDLDDPEFDPGSDVGSESLGISGTNVVGVYGDANNYVHGFLYNGSTWKTLDDPAGDHFTAAFGISETNVIGYSQDAGGIPHGFIYNLVTGIWFPLDYPRDAGGTEAVAVSGSNVAGQYTDASNNTHGFIYNIVTKTWRTLDAPKAVGFTAATGISGDNITGVFLDSGGIRHGFLYNMITLAWITLDDPLAMTGGTVPQGIYGDTVVGRDFTDATHQYGLLATPIPSLGITNSGNALTVSWPFWNDASLGWTLQQSADLSTTNWTPCAATVSNDGTNNFIALPSSAGKLFFRLRQQ